MADGQGATRVLVVIPSLGQGGAELSTVESIEPMAERGIDVQIVALRDVQAGVAHLAPEGTVTTLRPGGRLSQLRQLRQVIRVRAPHLVHTLVFDADLVGRLAAWRTGAVVITSIVNTRQEDAPGGNPRVKPWKLRLVRWVERVSGRVCNAGFHAISETTRDTAIDRLGISPDDIVVVPRARSRRRLGEASTRRRGAVRADLGLDPEVPVVVNIGRHEWQKAQDTLISAIRAVAERHPDVRLLIAGRPGALTNRLSAQIAALELDTTVTLLGHRDDIGDILAAADVFAFPSRYEGLGGSLLEAMAMDVAIVTSDIAPTRETAAESALYVPVDEPDALADAINRLLDDAELRRRLASAGRQRFETVFDEASVMDAMAAMYQRFVAEHS